MQSNFSDDEIFEMYALLGVVWNISDEDVLMGRGGHNSHVGNQSYLDDIRERQPRYRTLTSNGAKTEFINDLVQSFKRRGTRFLTGDSREGPWYIVSDEQARRKVSQALRDDGITPEGRDRRAERRARAEANRVTP